LVVAAARFRIRAQEIATPLEGTRQAMRSLARRVLVLEQELAELDRELALLVGQAAPGLIALPGVGPECAGTLLVTAGDNPERLGSEAAFAALCGVSPLDASSGLQRRHRLNRGGDRQANQALWRITLVRMRHDARTRAYVARRTEEGRTPREIMRCLKRYIAREVYRELVRLPAIRQVPPLGS
jgi:transposase